ncbi:hypothetical protein [Arcanobacterium canis]
MARISPPDLEMYLIGVLRRELAKEKYTAKVTNKEPDNLQTPLKEPLIVIRDDGGPQLSALTLERGVGVNVLAGTAQYDAPARKLARFVYSILSSHDDVALEQASPIVSVNIEGCNGPYNVPETQNVTRMYSTFSYNVVADF